jgi:hypothetical protein
MVGNSYDNTTQDMKGGLLMVEKQEYPEKQYYFRLYENKKAMMIWRFLSMILH